MTTTDTAPLLETPAESAPTPATPPASPTAPNLALSIEDYRQLRGLGTATFTPDEITKLRAVVPDDELDILPTGEVYLHQIGYRQRLLDTFGPGAWGLVALSEPMLRDDTLMQIWALVIRGQVVATAPGEANYKTDRAKARKWEMAYGTALESAKSNALMRCCKDIGVAAACWDRRFTEGWKDKYAVHVYRTDRNSSEEYDEWRTLERGPHWNETGVHPGSPNKAAWKTQVEAAQASGYLKPQRAGGNTRQAPASRGSSAPPPMNLPENELPPPDDADQRPAAERRAAASRSRTSSSKPTTTRAAAGGGGNDKISDAQYNYMKGMLRTNHVEAPRLFAWLKRIHKVDVPDGHAIPKRLFNACKAWIEAGGPDDTEVGG